jgi:transcriptional regulator with XRE-family HTH domain
LANQQLRNWRKAKNLSQQDVADQMGVTRETYSSYEQGRRLPSVYSLFAMEKVLGVTARNIYDSFDGTLATDSYERSMEFGCDKNSQIYFKGV